MARSAKKTQVVTPAPTIAENVVIEPEVVETKKTVAEKRKFVSDDRIPCKSVLVGKTHLLGKRTNMIYTFLGRNDTIGIEYQDLVAEVRAGTNLLFRPMIIVEDQDFINEFPKLKQFYENLYPVSDLKALLKRPVREIQAILPNLPAGVVDSMKSVAADMVRTGELDSISTIRALDSAWGTDLAILTGLNSDTE